MEQIKIESEFTIDSLLEYACALKDALGRLDKVVVDATTVRKTDIAALQLLVAAQKESREKGASLVFRVSNEIASMQKLAGIEFDAS